MPSPAATAENAAVPRAFGTARVDLEVDFRQRDRLALALQVVAACVAPPPGVADWADASISQRIRALLEVVAVSAGRPALALELRCTACPQGFEIELPLADLIALDPSSPEAVRLPGGLVLRRPTGRDQLAWRRDPAAARAPARAVAASLRVAGELPAGDESLASLAVAMAEADPLTAFRVATGCPHCGAVQNPAVDLESLALGVLATEQHHLVATVHRLASAYGWSENEILAIPPWRRRRYLERLDAEKGDGW